MADILTDIIDKNKQYEGTTHLQSGQKNDPPGSPVGPYGHGQDGIFYLPRSNNSIVSAIIGPRGGVLDVIPVLNEDPYEDNNLGNFFGAKEYTFDTIMTGVTEGNIEDFANQPTGECDPGPTGGMTKLCTIVNTLGNYKGRTKEVGLVRAGLAQDRLDAQARNLLNSAVALQGFFGTPDSMPEQNAIIMNEMARRLFELLFPFRRFFSQHIWEATPANNNGWARQFVGLNIHINSGTHVDAFSSAICTAADGVISDFGYNLVNGSNPDIVERLEYMEHVSQTNVSRMGLGPVDGVIVMRETLFRALTGVFPVKQYQEVLASLQTINGADRSRIMIDATGAQAARNNFRTQLQIPLNGRMYRVVLDDGIPESHSGNDANLTGANQFASDIYFVPLTVVGGLPATFFDYYNHENMQAQGILSQVTPNTFTFTSDGGSFRWNLNYQNSCLDMNFQFMPRLKMKFPMAAWRLSNVAYEPDMRAHSPYPADDYFVNGGVTTQESGYSFYAPWSPSTPVSS